MNPLLVQIAIGAGGLLLGFLIGTLIASRRLRNTRKRALEMSDELENRMALQRLQLRELEEQLEEAKRHGAPVDQLPDSVTQMMSVTPTRPRWLASPADRTPDSAPPRA